MTDELARWDGKRLKLFFVEMDDENRERVLSCQVEYVTIKKDVDYADVLTDMSFKPVTRFVDNIEITLEARIVPQEDGTAFRLENFAEPEEEEDDEYSD